MITRRQSDIVAFFGAVFVLALAPARCMGCTCLAAPGKTMRDVAVSRSEGQYASKVIFEGLLEKQEAKTGAIGPPANTMSMTTFDNHRMAYFRVLRTYRGSVPQSATVLTGIGLGDCGFDFETGKQYLVYADRVNGDILFTSICTGTSLSEQAGPALRFLREERPTADDLLDVESYYAKFLPQWTATVCGHVTMPGSRPLNGASVELTQIRDEPFPPMRFADQNMSKEDGSFCIRDISPGNYLLTAERPDFKESFRLMGYYPGVRKRADAVPIEIHAGDNSTGIEFKTQMERLYTVRFRIVTADGSPIPVYSLGIAVDSPNQDGLAYHLTQNGNENGIFYAGYVPACYCTVQTYIKPVVGPEKVPPELTKWRMAKQEIIIPSKDDVIVITLNPAN